MCNRKHIYVMDDCMVAFIHRLNVLGVKTLASCCGHGKYPKTVVCQADGMLPVELFSGEIINRKRKFYKRDKEGFYYIPEVQMER